MPTHEAGLVNHILGGCLKRISTSSDKKMQRYFLENNKAGYGRWK
jgi:hypothetical protein